ncbi:MAG: hypothetical protein ACT4PU_08875 [Planctomycetota bacterium]
MRALRRAAGLALPLLLACAAAAKQSAPVAPPPGTLLVDGLLNGGFEQIADSTSQPPKYGAYWKGAFAPTAEESWSHVVTEAPFRGERCLRLTPAAGEVLQKLVGDARFTESLVVGFAVRPRAGARLQVVLEDGPGRRVLVSLSEVDGQLLVHDAAGAEVAPVQVRAPEQGWHRIALDMGALFVAQHGQAAEPRLNLRLSVAATGSSPSDAEGALLVDIDEVSAGVRWPAIDAAALSGWIAETVRWTLDTWLLPRAEGGLQLVDPQSGYATFTRFHVQSGETQDSERFAGFHTIHNLLVAWLKECRRRGWTDEIAARQPALQAIVRSVLERHFDETTGLPRMIDTQTGRPTAEAATVAAWVDFLLDAREQLGDEELRARCLAQARRIADTLIALQREHDIPADRAPPLPQWDPKQGRIVGDLSNWWGHIPDRLTPQGEIETHRRFYTSWAILTGRSFWYELMRSPRAILRVHALAPRPADLPAVQRALSRFERPWDAARYDLENDTDDHYGYLCEDLLGALHEVLAVGGAPAPETELARTVQQALALVQLATDHRLERRTSRADDTLWIQAVRLGTACAGDSPRAFFGPLELYELPAALNPASAGSPLYREALMELARNDLKGRQLTNGQFTESFFKHWEMVCICFRGTYQGDCREQPESYWNGDVGDTFGGPPTAAIDAQGIAYRVARADERPVYLAALALLRDVTEASLRRQHGYVFGLDEAIARQYELPDKYVIGLDETSAAGLGYVMAWLRLLPHLPQDRGAPVVQIDLVESPVLGSTLRVRGPVGVRVALPVSARPFPAPISAQDARLLALDLSELPGGVAAAPIVVLGPNGEAHLPLSRLPVSRGVVQPLVLDASNVVLSVGEPFAMNSR